ncbi:cupin domain-containing protein [Klebsiella michiganensis]|uniref:cupin domain-containing protein n=1 Tax=Klebsiella TaxID=570 RepID=UPI000DE713D9|nr:MULTISPECIES: cupin domain-containing protein [Klebsiella]MEB6370960.1 cupin domain-containing protein [Klebsiella michiganensis]UXO79584.1 cupin domain-containing protein [Klebsiella michiganensis]SSG28789.1 Cupin domain [Klebsiella pneumoniae]HBZ7326239.1 cupin domain-containing protein [Klebsiella pneumoniae]HBZ7351944.1 cupin domain-containing protein [Klebsiella pneumoniae]
MSNNSQNLPQPPKELTPEIEQAMANLIKYQDIKPIWAKSADPSVKTPALKYTDIERGNIAPNARPAVISQEFRMLNGLVAPGLGAPLHHHTGEELMFAVTGTWVVFFDEEEKYKVILEPWDAILVPANMYRGWRNVGREPGYFMNIGSPSDKMVNYQKPTPAQAVDNVQQQALDEGSSDCSFS